MAKKGNKYKIGALALIAIIILILGLLSLGVMKYFQPKVYFMTSTTSSVQGLKVGSNLKVKGVTIGAVKDIKIGLKGEIIFIIMRVDLDTILDHTQGETIFQRDDAQKVLDEKTEEFIKNGLRCQLQYEGITGDLYVDMAYFDPAKYPPIIPELPKNHHIYIPLVPSPSIGNVLASAQEIVKKINEVDFKKISDNFDSLIITIEEFTLQLREIINQKKIDELGNNVDSSLNKFNQTMTSLNLLIKTIQMQPDSVVWGKAGQKVVPSLNGQ